MKINRAGRWGVAVFTAALAAGCTPSPTPPVAPTPAVSASATPKPTATPPQIAAQVFGANVTLFGKNGDKAATLKGESAAFDPKSLSSALIVNKAKATLYNKGKTNEDDRNAPAAELSADVVTADRPKRTLTATGNVTIRSLTEKGTPTIRADRMVWSFGNRTIVGDGNVLLTAEPNLKMPGKSFAADTRLRTFQLESDGRPATGGLP